MLNTNDDGNIVVTIVEFIKPVLPYGIGERAGFDRERAERLVNAKLAKYTKNGDNVVIGPSRGDAGPSRDLVTDRSMTAPVKK